MKQDNGGGGHRFAETSAWVRPTDAIAGQFGCGSTCHTGPMNRIAFAAISVLEQAGVELAPGLTGGEIRSVRERFGFEFAQDHLDLLSSAMPVGDRWPDWRGGDDSELRRMLDWPIDGFVWDALNQEPPFWPPSWGARPKNTTEVERTVRSKLAERPTLVPIHGRRYTPAAPAPSGSPVFSVYQTDVTYYGPDLVEYLRNELGIGAAPRDTWSFRTKVPFWSRFVESANHADSI